MEVPIKLRKNLSPRRMRFIAWGSLCAAVLVSSPQIVLGIQSYASWGLVLLAGVLSFLFIDFLAEYLTSFSTKSGGVYTHLVNVYSRFIGFLIGVVVILGGYLFIINDFFSYFSTSMSSLYSVAIFLAFGIGVTILLRRPFAVLYLMYALAAFSAVTLVGLLTYFIFIFESTYPIVGPVSYTWSEIIFTSLFPLILTWFPISFLIAEMWDIEEEFPDIAGKVKWGFLLIIPLFVLLFMGALDVTILTQPVAFAQLFSSLPPVFSVLVRLGGASAHLLIIVLWLYALPRLVYEMASDELLFKGLGKGDGQVLPGQIISLQVSLLSVITVLYVIFETFALNLLDTLLFGLVVCLALLSIGITVFRVRSPEIERPFSVRRYKLLPLLVFIGIIATLVCHLLSDTAHFLHLAGFLAIGFMASPVYFFIERWYNERLNSKFDEWFIPLRVALQYITFPKHMRTYILEQMGDKKGKRILDYGCKYGALAVPLSEMIGTDGILYATDISQKLVDRLKQKLDKKGYSGYVFIFTHTPSSVNLSIPQLDMVVSAFSFARVRRQDTLLKQMNNLLKTSGKVVIIERDKLFHVLPNRWLSRDELIKDFFDRNGFGVSITRFRGLFSQYVMISGIKFKDAYYLDTWYTQKDFYGE